MKKTSSSQSISPPPSRCSARAPEADAAPAGTGPNVGFSWTSGPSGIAVQNRARKAARKLETAELRRAAGAAGAPRARVDAACMTELGERLLDGVPEEHLAPDAAEAARLFETASSECGFSYATFCLAGCYFAGQGVPRDDREGFRLTQLAADASLVEAIFCLGGCYERGCGVRRSLETAIKWFRRAASYGDEEARDAMKRCTALLDAENAAEAERDRKRREALGDDASSTNSQMSEPAPVPPPAPAPPAAQAEKWHGSMFGDLKRAADAGDPFAQNCLALRYVDGLLGAKRDEERALFYWRRACAAGHAPAQLELGERLFRGNGVPADFDGAIALLSRAAQQGEARALLMLGTAFELGECVPLEEKKVAKKKALVYRDRHAAPVAPIKADPLLSDDVPPATYGPRRDVVAAIATYRMSAELGCEPARVSWRRMERAQRANIWEVLGLDSQRKEHAKWRAVDSFSSLKLNSDGGQAGAQFELAMRLRAAAASKPVIDRLRVLKQAGQLYKFAAEQGYAFAQEALGDLYYDGSALPRNFKVAQRLYRLAAEQGLASAQNAYAQCLESGEGFEDAETGEPRADVARAYTYYARSAAQGYPLAVQAKERLDAERKWNEVGPAEYTIRVSVEKADRIAAIRQEREMLRAPLGASWPAIPDSLDDPLVSAVWPALVAGVAARPQRAPAEGGPGAFTPADSTMLYFRPEVPGTFRDSATASDGELGSLALPSKSAAFRASELAGEEDLASQLPRP